MSSMPRRIQRQRTKGWRMPEGAVYVGRPTQWGNPYRLSDYQFAHADGTPAPHDVEAARRMAVRDFEAWLEVTTAGNAMRDRARRELRGKDLACWCPLPSDGETDDCHASVLLEVANERAMEADRHVPT